MSLSMIFKIPAQREMSKRFWHHSAISHEMSVLVIPHLHCHPEQGPKSVGGATRRGCPPGDHYRH